MRIQLTERLRQVVLSSLKRIVQSVKRRKTGRRNERKKTNGDFVNESLSGVCFDGEFRELFNFRSHVSFFGSFSFESYSILFGDVVDLCLGFLLENNAISTQYG